MANSIQLKFVIKNKNDLFKEFYSAQVGLGVTSVIFAAIIGKYKYFLFEKKYDSNIFNHLLNRMKLLIVKLKSKIACFP